MKFHSKNHNGNLDTIAMFIREHERLLRCIIKTYIENVDDAEDVFQEATLAAETNTHSDEYDWREDSALPTRPETGIKQKIPSCVQNIFMPNSSNSLGIRLKFKPLEIMS